MMYLASSLIAGTLLFIPASSSSSSVASGSDAAGAALNLLATLASRQAQALDHSISTGDSALMLVCGVVLVALQLRRRQKAMRTARFTF